MILLLATPEGPPPFQPDVDGAVVDLKYTLDFFRDSLHYTVARTKLTHAYKAMVKLGGVWP